jgi:hypothetical protein
MCVACLFGSLHMFVLHTSQLLFEIEVKLRVTDATAVEGVLGYVTHAVIWDFPPEVLLQRPEMLRYAWVHF